MRVDTIVAVLIVLLAAVYLLRRVRLWVSGRSSNACGCGCSGCARQHACMLDEAEHPSDMPHSGGCP